MAKQTVSDAQVYAMARSILGREPNKFIPGKGNDFLTLAKRGYTERQILSMMNKESQSVPRPSNSGIFSRNKALESSLNAKYVAKPTAKTTAKPVAKTVAKSNPTPTTKKIPTVEEALANRYNQEKNIEKEKATTVKTEQANTQALLTRLKNEEAGLYKQLQNELKAQEGLPDAYKRISQEEKIPELQRQLQEVREQAFNTSDLLDRLDEDVTSRDKGFMVTDAQRRRQIAAEGDSLRNSLARLVSGQGVASDQLSTASGNLQNQLNMLATQQNKMLEPLRGQISAFAQRAAREMTGFTSDKEMRLAMLQDKINAGRQLSTDEYNLANTLAAEKRAYDKQLGLNEQQFGMEKSLIQSNLAADLEKIKESAKYSTGSGDNGITLNLGDYGQTTQPTTNYDDAWAKVLAGLTTTNQQTTGQNTTPYTPQPALSPTTISNFTSKNNLTGNTPLNVTTTPTSNTSTFISNLSKSPLDLLNFGK